MADIRNDELDDIFGRAVLTGESLLSEVRSTLVRRISRRPLGNLLDSETMSLARSILERTEPILAQSLIDAQLAAGTLSVVEIDSKLPQSAKDLIQVSSTGRPPLVPLTPLGDTGGNQPVIRFPVLERAAESVAQRNPITRPVFDQMDIDAQAKAFTVARQVTEESIGRIRDLVNESVREGWDLKLFRDNLGESLESGFIGPAHVCFLPGTEIQGNVVAASKLRYDGPAIEIETATGKRLSVTVDHPVLTSAGWKNAGFVKQGDDLACYGRRVEAFDPPDEFAFPSSRRFEFPKDRTINDEKTPTLVEDVFESLPVESAAFRDRVRPVSSLDFDRYRSIADSNVCRVRSDRKRENCGSPLADQIGNQIALMVRNVRSPSTPPGSGGSLFDLFFQRSFSAGSADSHCGTLLDGFFSTVMSTKSSPGNPLRIGSAANLDPRFFQATEKRPGGDAKLYRKLISILPRFVASDRVVNVKRIWWTGHVYDIQTTTGFVVSDGIVSSNSNVYRTNIQTAFHKAHDEFASMPVVSEVFPYQRYLPIDDGRVRDEHLALASLGIDGTNIYRRDDRAFWDNFLPPWSYQCRCGVNLMTIEAAARSGVREAIEWQETGVQPPLVSRLPDIPFRPEPGFVGVRGVSSAA